MSTAQEIYDHFEEQEASSSQRILAELLRNSQEEHPTLDFLSGFVPGISQAVGAADFAASQELEEPLWLQLLYAAGAIPGVRPARKVIAALDDLPEGGLRTLFNKLMGEGIMTPDQAARAFTDSGDLRLYHGTNDLRLKNLTTEGADRYVREYGSWGGPGTYLSGNLYSPLNIPNADRLQVLEATFPRENIDKLALTNFSDTDFQSFMDYRDALGMFGLEDQTGRVRDIIQEMYSDVPPEEAFRLFNISPMASNLETTDRLQRVLGGDVAKASSPSGATLEFENPQATMDYLRGRGLAGNVHSDSYSYVVTSQDPDMLSTVGRYKVDDVEALRDIIAEGTAFSKPLPSLKLSEDEIAARTARNMADYYDPKQLISELKRVK